MHKGMEEEQVRQICSPTIMAVMVIIARAGFKSFQSAEDAWKLMRFTMSFDKGSSVAVEVVNIDPSLVLNGHNII